MRPVHSTGVDLSTVFILKSSDSGAQCCVDYVTVLSVCLGISFLGLLMMAAQSSEEKTLT